MKVSVIEIGNSKGIRIPAAILKQFDITNQVELEVKTNSIVLRPVKQRPRDGWDKALKLMHDRKEDTLILDEMPEAEMENWEWK